MSTPAEYGDYAALVRAVALDVESEVTRGAFADWLEDRGFPAEAAAVRALAGLWWCDYANRRHENHPGGTAYLTPVEPGGDRGWVNPVLGLWQVRLWRPSDEHDGTRVGGGCDSLDDGKACVVAALIANRRWCEGDA